MTAKIRLKVGDMVKPGKEWHGDPNRIPSGRVREIVVNATAVYIEGNIRGWSPHVFEIDEMAGQLDLPLVPFPEGAP